MIEQQAKGSCSRGLDHNPQGRCMLTELAEKLTVRRA